MLSWLWRLSPEPKGRASASNRAGMRQIRPLTDKNAGRIEKSLVFQMLPVDGREPPMTFYSSRGVKPSGVSLKGAGDDQIRTGCTAYRSLSASVPPRCRTHRDNGIGFDQQGIGRR